MNINFAKIACSSEKISSKSKRCKYLQKILDRHDALLVETDTNSKSFTLDKITKDNLFKKINLFIISNKIKIKKNLFACIVQDF